MRRALISWVVVATILIIAANLLPSFTTARGGFALRAIDPERGTASLVSAILLLTVVLSIIWAGTFLVLSGRSAELGAGMLLALGILGTVGTVLGIVGRDENISTAVGTWVGLAANACVLAAAVTAVAWSRPRARATPAPPPGDEPGDVGGQPPTVRPGF